MRGSDLGKPLAECGDFPQIGMIFG
ncbi:hypothetical protein FRAAL2710 [Frankia alni ACN14a]|uniref:Uncharacterized protein n=1 Tax=Frankia alni (strain DSM 45986 / CECT 9034 / ACN14a) TaxID=326424 RepID=Q0RM96_FRAAA|nr:hypothetical protein FRAAL2710 [Frankia alni ACN14a]